MLVSYLKEHYGDLASVIALVITLVGFFITIRNTKKAKEEAEEAKRAAREMAQRIGGYLLINEVTSCLQFVRAADSACRERRWSEALDRCDDARTHLSRLRENPGLQEAEVDALDTMTKQISKLIQSIQRSRKSDPPRDLSPQKMQDLHEMVIMIGRIQGRLQTRVMEA